MGYKVDYAPVDRAFRNKKNERICTPMLCAGFFVLFLFLVRLCWSRGVQVMQTLLIPEDLAFSLDALEAFADRLSAGESFGDSLFVFCHEIIQRAGVGIV